MSKEEREIEKTLRKGYNVEIITEILGVSNEEVEKVRKEIDN